MIIASLLPQGKVTSAQQTRLGLGSANYLDSAFFTTRASPSRAPGILHLPQQKLIILHQLPAPALPGEPQILVVT